MKPRVMVLEDVEVEKWREYHVIDMSFDEAMTLIKDLQNGLFDERNLRKRTGLNFRIVIRPGREVMKDEASSEAVSGVGSGDAPGPSESVG